MDQCPQPFHIMGRRDTKDSYCHLLSTGKFSSNIYMAEGDSAAIFFKSLCGIDSSCSPDPTRDTLRACYNSFPQTATSKKEKKKKSKQHLLIINCVLNRTVTYSQSYRLYPVQLHNTRGHYSLLSLVLSNVMPLVSSVTLCFLSPCNHPVRLA